MAEVLFILIFRFTPLPIGQDKDESQTTFIAVFNPRESMELSTFKLFINHCVCWKFNLCLGLRVLT